MVTRYDGVISSRWSSHFWAKMHVFSIFSGIMVKLVDKMMHCFNLILIFDKIDGDHYWWSHRPTAALPPIKYTSPVEKVKSFPLKEKSFQKIATSKLPGRMFHQPPRPPEGYNNDSKNNDLYNVWGNLLYIFHNIYILNVTLYTLIWS